MPLCSCTYSNGQLTQMWLLMQTFIPGRQQFARLGGDVQSELQQTYSQLDQKRVSCKVSMPFASQPTFILSFMLFPSHAQKCTVMHFCA